MRPKAWRRAVTEMNAGLTPEFRAWPRMPKFLRLSAPASWVIRQWNVRVRRTILREEFVARFATSTTTDAQAAKAAAPSRALLALLLLSRP